MPVVIAVVFLACGGVVHALDHHKSQRWYPYYGGVLDLLPKGDCTPEICDRTVNCSAQLAAYVAAENIHYSKCYGVDGALAVYDCLSSGLLPTEASNFQSAEVLLGLTPTLLATLAPSIGEITLLSTRRKLLALLLALGNPAISIPRLLCFTNPTGSLIVAPTIFPGRVLELHGWQAAFGSALQYIIALAAIANVVQVSWQLGIRTVIAWKCSSSYLPFLWASLPSVIHLVSAVGWHFSSTTQQIRKRKCTHDTRRSSLWSQFIRTFREEVQLPSQYGPLGLPEQDGLSLRIKDRISMFVNELAGFGAFLHILFGTLVFSSLMFIATIDALVVIVRYIVSGLVCRFVVAWELAAMRALEHKEPDS